MSETGEVRRALLAVYDKTGIVELARALRELDVELVSSGGTAAVLRDADVDVTSVDEVTGSPEMLGGRVKTLHPRIHAGLLADRRNADHVAQLEAHEIAPFDLVVVNLYPFRETVASGADTDDSIEMIDIGGPAMIRAAAKNHANVAIVVEPSRYDALVEELRRDGAISDRTRRSLAAEAFAHTAAYDAAVAGWFASEASRQANEPDRQHQAGESTRSGEVPVPAFIGLAFEKVEDLRYGENPHQRGALFREVGGPGVLGGAEVVRGPETSYNNWLDAWAAYELALALGTGGCVIVKHNNPCGAAVRSTPGEAYRAALASDDVSAFGGVVAFHDEVDGGAAEAMRGVVTHVVIAPAFTPEALDLFSERKNLRVLRAPARQTRVWDVRTLPGGALIQKSDVIRESRADWSVASVRQPTAAEWVDLELAWTVAWRVKSNAIVFVKDRATVGVGAGQMSRVDASWIAARKAGERARGAVVASDAFFPFPDALEVAADAGCTAVIHPGGSKGDDEVLKAAEAHDMAVVLTGVRHFRH